MEEHISLVYTAWGNRTCADYEASSNVWFIPPGEMGRAQTVMLVLMSCIYHLGKQDVPRLCSVGGLV